MIINDKHTYFLINKIILLDQKPHFYSLLNFSLSSRGENSIKLFIEFKFLCAFA